MDIWNLNKVNNDIISAFDKDSEKELLAILKENSFLFYALHGRNFTVQPIFREVEIGSKRCDFVWLNDNSSGPEWVLVEIKKPKMKLFTIKNNPTAELNSAIHQIKTWQMYFKENPNSKTEIFGAVAKFKYILVAGSKDDWSEEYAMKYRRQNNEESNITIRSSDIFFRALNILENSPEELFAFENYPTTLLPSDLESYWRDYGYMDRMRQIF